MSERTATHRPGEGQAWWPGWPAGDGKIHGGTAGMRWWARQAHHDEMAVLELGERAGRWWEHLHDDQVAVVYKLDRIACHGTRPSCVAVHCSARHFSVERPGQQLELGLSA